MDPDYVLDIAAKMARDANDGHLDIAADAIRQICYYLEGVREGGAHTDAQDERAIDILDDVATSIEQ